MRGAWHEIQERPWDTRAFALRFKVLGLGFMVSGFRGWSRVGSCKEWICQFSSPCWECWVEARPRHGTLTLPVFTTPKRMSLAGFSGLYLAHTPGYFWFSVLGFEGFRV